MKGFYKLILFVVTVAAIIGGCIMHFGIGKAKNSSEKAILDENYGESVNAIKINAALMDISFSEGDECSVSYQGSKELMPDCSFDSDKKCLIIKQKSNIKPNKNLNYESKLTIVVPKQNRLSEFDLELSMGNVEGAELISEEVEISDNLGNVSFERIEAASIDIDANLGDVRLEKVKASEIEIDASLGNAIINLEDDINTYEIKAEASLGTITIGNDKYNKSFTQAGNKGNIDINCSLGNVEIR